MRVVVTGIPVLRANFRRSASASEVMIPPPTYKTGGRLFDQAQDFIESHFVWRGKGAKSGNIHCGGPGDLSRSFLHVFRNIDHYGAWATRGSDVEGFCDNAGDVAWMHDEVTMFDDGQGDAEYIGFLKGASADRGCGDLARDGNHRNGVHKGIGDSCDKIGSTGA